MQKYVTLRFKSYSESYFANMKSIHLPRVLILTLSMTLEPVLTPHDDLFPFLLGTELRGALVDISFKNTTLPQ